MKAYTDIKQSKKLAEILPVNSADMKFPYFGDGQYGATAVFGEAIEFSDGKDIPCWSLAALLDILNYSTLMHEFHGNEKGKWFLSIYDHDETYRVWENDPIDACVEMILKLK